MLQRRSALWSWAALPISGTKLPAAADPVLILETAKGTIQIQLFRSEAPKSVDHMLALVKRSFYRGQRFHRVTAMLVQVGDPQSRDMSRKDYWGTGNSGSPIGVFELSKKRLHVRGAVGLAHSGNPLGADSQFYIMKGSAPDLNGKHAIVGQSHRRHGGGGQVGSHRHDQKHDSDSEVILEVQGSRFRGAGFRFKVLGSGFTVRVRGFAVLVARFPTLNLEPEPLIRTQNQNPEP